MTISEQAKQVYEHELKSRLEAHHLGQFVAIEPHSKEYFLGDTFIAAALAAKEAHPDRKSFVFRIGHAAAFHIGAVPSLYGGLCPPHKPEAQARGPAARKLSIPICYPPRSVRSTQYLVPSGRHNRPTTSIQNPLPHG
jgi:hypothetical protein